MNVPLKADLLYGVPAIAEFLGLGNRQVYHLHEIREIPTFHIGGKVCAKKTDIQAWIDQKAQEARK